MRNSIGAPNEKPRLLRIQLATAASRRALLKMRMSPQPGLEKSSSDNVTKSTVGNTNGIVFFRPDLTPLQQDADRKLRAELIIKGKDKFKINRGIIVPRNPTLAMNCSGNKDQAPLNQLDKPISTSSAPALRSTTQPVVDKNTATKAGKELEEKINTLDITKNPVSSPNKPNMGSCPSTSSILTSSILTSKNCNTTADNPIPSPAASAFGPAADLVAAEANARRVRKVEEKKKKSLVTKKPVTMSQETPTSVAKETPTLVTLSQDVETPAVGTDLLTSSILSSNDVVLISNKDSLFKNMSPSSSSSPLLSVLPCNLSTGAIELVGGNDVPTPRSGDKYKNITVLDTKGCKPDTKGCKSKNSTSKIIYKTRSPISLLAKPVQVSVKKVTSSRDTNSLTPTIKICPPRSSSARSASSSRAIAPRKSERISKPTSKLASKTNTL